MERRQLFAAAIAFATPITVDLRSAGTDLVAGRFGGPAGAADGVAVRTGGTVTAFGLAPNGTLATIGAVAFDPLAVPGTVVAGDLNGDGFDDITLVSTRDGFISLNPYLAGGTAGGFTGGTVGDTLTYLDAYNPAYAGRRAVYLPGGTADGGAPRIALLGSALAGVYAGPGNQLSTTRPAFDFLDATAAGGLGTDTLQYTLTGPSIVAPAVTAVTAGDFNGDGNADVAAVDASTGGIDYQITPTHEVAGALTDPTTIRHLAASVTDLTTADVNGDGRADLIGWGDPSNPDAIMVWLGQANGTLTAGRTITLAGPVTAVAAADFNGDGTVDLATNLGVSAGHGDGTFDAAVALPTGVPVGTQLVATDVNGDGRSDLVALSADGTTLQVLPNADTYAAKAPALIRLATPTPAPVGSPIRLTASVTVASGTPTGSVTFLDGTTPLGTATVDASGTATFVTSSLPIGAHSVTARYEGDATFASAVSTPVTAHVQAAVSLAYDGPYQNFFLEFTRGGVSTGIYYYDVNIALINADGSPLTLGGLPAPTGGLSITLGGDTFSGGAVNTATSANGYYEGSIALDDANGGYQNFLPGGTYTATLHYSGDANYAPATSTGLRVTIPGPEAGNSANPPAAPKPVLLYSTTPAPTPSPTPPLTTTCTITGTLFIDANANGFDDLVSQTTDAHEAGLAGQTVYLDENGNGRPDRGEPSTTTAADGTFSFADLPVGRSYAVSLVAPAGYEATVPANGPTWVMPTAVNPTAAVSIGVAPTGTAPPVPPLPARVTSPYVGVVPIPTVAPLPVKVISAAPASADHATSAAVDGDPNTYYDAAGANSGALVLDLGPTVPYVTTLAYAVRPGEAIRMLGGVFQCSSSPTFTTDVTTVYTVTGAPADGQLAAVYVESAKRYWRYVAPDGGHGDIAEFDLYRNPANVPVTASGLTPALVATTLPKTAVAGRDVSGVVRVSLTNTSASAVNGTYAVNVYVEPIDFMTVATNILVGTLRKKVKLRVGGIATVAVRVRLPASLGVGSGALLTGIGDDTPGNTQNEPVVYLVAPVAALSATVVSTGKHGVVVVSVSNTGNIPTAGPITVTILMTRSDGTTATVAVRKPAIQPGRRAMVIRVATRVAAGQWTPTVTLSATNADPLTVVGAALTVA